MLLAALIVVGALMKPEMVGMSSARLARLDEVMKRRYVDGGYLPGMLTQIYRTGHLIHSGICGHTKGPSYAVRWRRATSPA
jgi:hypothetical protein